METPDTVEVAMRIAAALVAGAVIGIDRELQRKPAGLRTHSLVSIGAALVVVASLRAGGDADAVSRVVQGIITGIGFLGGGVILQLEAERRIEGLTTAASIWVAAGLGVACGAGLWTLVAVGLVAAVLMLTAGNLIEDAVKRYLPRARKPAEHGQSDGPRA